MVGFFQFFGISFLFWIIVGCLRFIFETLRKLRDMPQKSSRINLVAASIAGVGLSASLFFLVFFSFGFEESLLLTANVSALHVSSFILWLACIGVGSYIAARIYVHEPYILSFAVSMGTLAAVTTSLLYSPSLSANLIPQNTGFAFLIFAATMGIGFIGGHIARSMNALERERDAVRREATKHARIAPEDVAILIAAHNEELTIGTTVASVLAFTDAKNVFVASDGSSDKTVDVVRSLGVHADDIRPNRGKAGAIVEALKRNELLDRYKAVFLMDADLKVDPDFFTHALPFFDNPSVAAVAGHLDSLWIPHLMPRSNMFFTAYRIRLWRILQFCVRYGQTWQYTNVSPIIPGGGSIYRSEVLKKITIEVPGLIIEDFNMTFEVHHKNLGLIAFDPKAFATTQEPFSLRDYTKQINRWYLGYFQTIRHHGIWPSWFVFSTLFFTAELALSSLLFALLPFFVLELLLSSRDSLFINIPVFGFEISLAGIAMVVFALDYIVTILVAFIERKPVLMFYGPAFFFLRYIETWIFLYALGVGLFTTPQTEGKWKSPKRVAYSK